VAGAAKRRIGYLQKRAGLSLHATGRSWLFANASSPQDGLSPCESHHLGRKGSDGLRFAQLIRAGCSGRAVGEAGAAARDPNPPQALSFDYLAGDHG
jgi:hypothetical protein